jgi:hypothetical protein
MSASEALTLSKKERICSRTLIEKTLQWRRQSLDDLLPVESCVYADDARSR